MSHFDTVVSFGGKPPRAAKRPGSSSHNDLRNFCESNPRPPLRLAANRHCHSAVVELVYASRPSRASVAFMAACGESAETNSPKVRDAAMPPVRFCRSIHRRYSFCYPSTTLSLRFVPCGTRKGAGKQGRGATGPRRARLPSRDIRNLALEERNPALDSIWAALRIAPLRSFNRGSLCARLLLTDITPLNKVKRR
jgi:hypothetical protein